MLGNFIYSNSKVLFLDELNSGNVPEDAVVFIVDTKEIWTHGTFFDGNYNHFIDAPKDDKCYVRINGEWKPEGYSPSINLSTQDIYGNPTAQNTANSYVVSKIGSYRFPIVYGNAIKNGKFNTAAYTRLPKSVNVTRDWESVYDPASWDTHDFVNHLGNQILMPYIEYDTDKKVTSVQLSIADVDGVFSNFSTQLHFEGLFNVTYVTFNVDTIPETGANGVISVKDEDGNVMWSWHIWVWPYDLTPVTITNSTGIEYQIMPVNLASRYDTNEENFRDITNWYYLFGRSMPSLGPVNSASNTFVTAVGESPFTSVRNENGPYLQSILNPTTFFIYTSGDNFLHWFSKGKSFYNLWNANDTYGGNSDSVVVKTVYDPCPPGFSMPNSNVFTGCTLDNVIGTFNKGYIFKRNENDTEGIFFASNGYLSNGNITKVNNRGLIWTSAAYFNECYHKNFDFMLNHVKPQQGYAASRGMSVRPIVEQ